MILPGHSASMRLNDQVVVNVINEGPTNVLVEYEVQRRSPWYLTVRRLNEEEGI